MFITVDKNGNNITDKIGELTRSECFNMGIDPDWNPYFLKEGEWYKVITIKEEREMTDLKKIEEKLFSQAIEELSMCNYDNVQKILSSVNTAQQLKPSGKESLSIPGYYTWLRNHLNSLYRAHKITSDELYRLETLFFAEER